MNINNIDIIAGVVILILILWVIFAELRFRKIFKSRSPKDFEDEQLVKYLESVEARLKKGCRGVGVVRFNPFEDAGSNQSFCIAFLNEEGDGVVISSLYSREKANIYAKPVKNSNSEYTLSEEEKQAIKAALQPNS